MEPVQLDSSGVFKYILIDVTDASSKKKLTFIRGLLTRNEGFQVPCWHFTKIQKGLGEQGRGVQQFFIYNKLSWGRKNQNVGKRNANIWI